MPTNYEVRIDAADQQWHRNEGDNRWWRWETINGRPCKITAAIEPTWPLTGGQAQQ